MSSYRPHYADDFPPPPPEMPPLPPGPPPSFGFDSRRGGDSWRPQGGQAPMPKYDFNFRNNDHAPQYPREQDRYRPMNSQQHPKQDSTRRRDYHNDNRNLNRSQRGQRGRGGRGNRFATSDRPLLRQRGGGDSPKETVGVTEGAMKFMAVDDVSDSEEEGMDQSDSDRSEHEIGGTGLDGQAEDESLEPPMKRQALESDISNSADSVPRWSNPDPYTVLPPVDDIHRKIKDPVKLLRKALKTMEDKPVETNAVVANDDFISFNMDEDNTPTKDEGSDAESAPSVGDINGARISGAPTGLRPSNHASDQYQPTQNGAPGASSLMSADASGPPPVPATVISISSEEVDGTGQSLPGAPRSKPTQPTATSAFQPGPTTNGSSVAEQIVIDTTENSQYHYFDDSTLETENPLGSRKRTHDDEIKRKPGRRGKMVHTGSLLPEWQPRAKTNPVPWLNRSNLLTINAGFRLHKEICDYYDFVKPQKYEQVIREELLSRLQTVLSRHFPDCRVHSFGSFAAGLYLPNADMDIVVISNDFQRWGQKILCQSHNQMNKLRQFILNSGLAADQHIDVVIGAKVPLLKFVDRVTGLKVDISFENDTGLVACQTFHDWKKQFPAMPVLVTVIKQFLMMRGLNEVFTGGLGGFSVTCLVTSLLQNLPRVQTGELVPGEHLGEILLEFLDFYGNQIDTLRTGIMMQPTGYFDKVAFTSSYGGRAGYQQNKIDRLAIMDPNTPENDISGGSKNVGLIFDRFSKAHAEILKAMKPGSHRPSLLDWLLGGDYQIFFEQRNRLRTIDQGRSVGGTDAKSNNDSFSGGRVTSTMKGHPTNASIDTYQGGHGTDHSSRSQKQHKPNPLNQSGPDVRPKRQTNAEKASGRANLLRRRFPNMTDVPDKVNAKQMKELIAVYEARQQRAQIIPPNGNPTAKQQTKTRSTPQTTKPTHRANMLKQQFPWALDRIPKLPTLMEYKYLKAQLQPESDKRKNAKTNEIRTNPWETQQLNKPPQAPAATSTEPGNGTKRVPLGGASVRPVMPLPARPPVIQSTSRFQPPSDARLAEVARNLMGNSNDEPIPID